MSDPALADLRIRRLATVAAVLAPALHDFNNAMTLAVGRAELLRNRVPDDDALRPHVDQVLQAAGRAAAIAKELAALSRGAEVPTEFDLVAWLDRTSVFVRAIVGRRFTVVVERPALAVLVLADPLGLELAFLDLVLKAKEAMVDGGTLTLGLAAGADGRHTVRVGGAEALDLRLEVDVTL